MNRKFLARAARLGFRDLYVYGDKVPVLCQDGSRQFVRALLEPKTAIPPAKDAIRIESSGTMSEVPVKKPQNRRRMPPVSESTTNPDSQVPSNAEAKANGKRRTNGQAKVKGQARNGTARKPAQDIDGLIHQAETLRTSLRDTLLKTNDLLKGLKRHRRQSRAVQSTIASLRELKGLGV
jgi:hypothetical protein